MLRQRLRRGFTLVELLVAIGLALVVLGLVVAVSQSSLTDSYKVTGAGDRLSQFLMTARNRAVRDKAPRGIRILNDEASRPSVIQYIEAPEAWVPSSAVRLHCFYPSDGSTVVVDAQKRFYLSSTNSGLFADFNPSVIAGDLLSVPELGWAYRVKQVIDRTAPPLAVPVMPAGFGTIQVELVLEINPDIGAGYSDTAAAQQQAAFTTQKFGFFRQAKELLGEPTQALATGMAVDWKNSIGHSVNTTNPPPPTGYSSFDVLFAPTGEVMNSNGSVISLLMRDFTYRGAPDNITTLTAANQSTTGEMILVAIYPRTGTVATKGVAPLSPSNTDLHKFAKDGINSGL